MSRRRRLLIAIALLLVLAPAPLRAAAAWPQVLLANAGTSVKASVPADVDQVTATQVHTGTRGYFFGINNWTDAPVTGATVRIDTGWPLSRFPGISALPIVATQAQIPPGGALSNAYFNALCCTRVPSSFAAGFASSRTFPGGTRIGLAGGTQTVQVSVTVTDAAFAGTSPQFAIGVGNSFANLPGVALLSSTAPTNLDQGERLQPGGGPPSSLIGWTIFDARLNKEYRFSATLQVPNPLGTPFDFKPWVFIVVVPPAYIAATGSGTAISYAQPSLDGAVPGSGRVTYSVDQTASWQVLANENHELQYEGLLSCENVEQARCGPNVDGEFGPK